MISTEKKIAEMRAQHVHICGGSTEERISALRDSHFVYAKEEARVRARGVKLHVIHEPNALNWCPYYKRTQALIVCMTQSTNQTNPICFGCQYPGAWALRGGHLTEHEEPSIRVRHLSRYIHGAIVATVEEPFMHQRALLPNGDVVWFKRYHHGQVEVDNAAHLDHSRPVRWWDAGVEDVAPALSSYSPEERTQMEKSAERKRSLMLHKRETQSE